MKNVFLITFLVSFYACSSPAQKNKITVDGRAFKIETFKRVIVNNFKN